MALERTAQAVGLESAAIALCALRRHQAEFGRYPNLLRPRTFNEKVLHRMVFDRRPILTTWLDKYAVRDYVRERIGEHVLPRLYWVTKTPADIPFDHLPDKFVVKPTHGSGWIYLVPDKARLNRQELIDMCNSWLGQNYYYTSGSWEWAYKHIEPRIVVEEFISDGSGLAPMDYRCYVCNGRVQMINVMAGRFVDLREDYYGRCWNRLDVTSLFEPIGEVPCPKHLDELIGCAETLGDELGFCRVDLYDAGKVYFGELTVYPVAGVKVFRPREWDRYLGSMCDWPSRKSRSPAAGTLVLRL